jgi:hypothetical protein
MPHKGDKALTSAVELMEKREEIKTVDEKLAEERLVRHFDF